MKNTLNKCWDIIPEQLRRKALLLLLMSAAMAILEAASVASLVPFMMVVGSPEVLRNDGWMGQIYQWSGASSENQFLVFLGVTTLVVLIGGNAFKAVTTWQINRFTYEVGHVLSKRLLSAYLAQPYEYFLTRHTGDLGKNVLGEVQQVVAGIIQPGMIALSRCAILVLLAVLLVAADPLIAVSVVITLGGAYGIIYAIMRNYMTRIGQDRVSANRERFHIAVESFGAIKEIKLKSLESVYAERFENPSRRFADHQASSTSLSLIPRYAIEVIAFGIIIVIVVYLLAAERGLQHVLPLVAVYTFAGYRLLPTMQEIFAGISKVRFSAPALDLLYQDLRDKEQRPVPRDEIEPLPFSDSIKFDDVTFRYSRGGKATLEHVDLEIKRGLRIGIVGQTGSGKSTAVDLVLGLLRPTEGKVLVDGSAIDDEETIRRWQANVGYVPQHIFIADDTVAANIAFGQPRERWDRTMIERSARMAQLHDFIVGELAEGYETEVGERGIRMSGGQRQRLGLARALYGVPKLLVLDEATSALDNATEDSVMAALDDLSADTTIIIIAHRLSTVRKCDSVYQVEEGSLTEVPLGKLVIHDQAGGSK